MPELEKEVSANGREGFDAKIAKCREAIAVYEATFHDRKNFRDVQANMWNQIPPGMYTSQDGRRLRVYRMVVCGSFGGLAPIREVPARDIDTGDMTHIPIFGASGFLEPVQDGNEWKPRYTYTPEGDSNP